MTHERDNIDRWDAVMNNNYKEFPISTPSMDIPEDIVDKCSEFSKERYELYSNHHPDSHNSRQANYNHHKTGLMGEYAFSCYYGLSEEQVFVSNPKGDGGFDFYCYCPHIKSNVKISVKTSTQRNCNLLVTKGTQRESNLHFLCERRGNSVGIIGFATWSMIEDNAKVINSTNQCYLLKRNQLREPLRRGMLEPIES